MGDERWIQFEPCVPPDTRGVAALHGFVDQIASWQRAKPDKELNGKLEHCRQEALRRIASDSVRGAQHLKAAVYLLADLIKQGWTVRMRAEKIEICRPALEGNEGEVARRFIQSQLHAERDEQLRDPSVREFVQAMEAKQLHNGRFVSIFSLIRDGRELAEALKRAADVSTKEMRPKAMAAVLQPYLQFVRGEERCPHTGLRLQDVWRYFRHTWANPYKSVPGRNVMVLVRDAAAPFHPVIGIGAISSSSVAMACRDSRIGWTPREFLADLRERPSKRLAVWLQRTVDQAIEDLFVDDFLESGLLFPRELRQPSPEVILRLQKHAKTQREKHHRLVKSSDYKKAAPADDVDDEFWQRQARLPLFVSKRALELAKLLAARAAIQSSFGKKPTQSAMVEFIQSREGVSTIGKVLRKAKADSVGIAMADLTVCGAVAPYNELLGGKLVAMMLTSPEVVVEIHRRYKKFASIIASSMAGRPIRRPPHIVFLGTTSLYGQRPSQYDRIQIPAETLGGSVGESIRYEYMGRTSGIGTFQFGEKTVEALSRLLSQSSAGQRVNSVFGEGVNPRLRKIRDGLDLLGVSANELLNHGAPRLVYGVRLARNVRDFLIGADKKPDYYFPLKAPQRITLAIVEWWIKRWALARLERPDTLASIAEQTLVHPVRHAARVKLPQVDDDMDSLFARDD